MEFVGGARIGEKPIEALEGSTRVGIANGVVPFEEMFEHVAARGVASKNRRAEVAVQPLELFAHATEVRLQFVEEVENVVRAGERRIRRKHFRTPLAYGRDLGVDAGLFGFQSRNAGLGIGIRIVRQLDEGVGHHVEARFRGTRATHAIARQKSNDVKARRCELVHLFVRPRRETTDDVAVFHPTCGVEFRQFPGAFAALPTAFPVGCAVGGFEFAEFRRKAVDEDGRRELPLALVEEVLKEPDRDGRVLARQELPDRRFLQRPVGVDESTGWHER